MAGFTLFDLQPSQGLTALKADQSGIRERSLL
jgi:hypothetical protein